MRPYSANIAQLAEQPLRKRQVMGSTPIVGFLTTSKERSKQFLPLSASQRAAAIGCKRGNESQTAEGRSGVGAPKTGVSASGFARYRNNKRPPKQVGKQGGTAPLRVLAHQWQGRFLVYVHDRGRKDKVC